MKPTIFLDMDGVLVDFVGGICRAWDRQWPYCDPASHGVWETWRLLGITEASFWKTCRDSRFWSRLDWMPDGQELLALVTRLVPIESVYLLTSPSQSPGSYAGKAEWVGREMPGFSGRLLMGSCKHLLAGYRGGLLIDDADHNVAAFKAAHGSALLVPRPWNARAVWADRSLERVELELTTWLDQEMHHG